MSRITADFRDAHGVDIHYYAWRIENPRAVIQLAHGLGDYALRYERLAGELNAAGYSVYANDHRGHGSTGLAQWGGDTTKLGKLGPGGLRAAVADLREFRQLIAAENPGTPIVLLGHSWGSIMSQRLLNTDSADYAAAILTGTAYLMPGSLNSGDLNKLHKSQGDTGYEWLSRDTEVSREFLADPHTFLANPLALFGLRDSLRFFLRPARSLAHDLPLLIMIGSEDSLGGPASVQRLAAAYRNRSKLSDVTVTVFSEARHEIFNETNRDEVVAALIAWLDRPGRVDVPGGHGGLGGHDGHGHAGG